MSAARPLDAEAAAAPESGHGLGTAPAVAGERRASQRRQRDSLSAWPRLLTLKLAGAYLSVGASTVLEWINAGDLPVVRAKRPRTAKALRHEPASDALRRLLVDVRDLDALADSFPKERR